MGISGQTGTAGIDCGPGRCVSLASQFDLVYDQWIKFLELLMNQTLRSMLPALAALALLLCLSACGGGSTPPVNNGGGGDNDGGDGGDNGGGLTIPPAESFQDLSPATDDNVTSWLKDVYHTLPETGDADGPYQNTSLK